MKTETKFIDLTFDYGFKIIFGNPDTPELMLGFLRELLPEREIVSIEFLNTEDMEGDESDKRVNFDIKCMEPDGGYFIVEMQKHGYSYFPDRLVVYAGGTIKHLLKRGEDYDNVRPLYVISVLDYLLNIPGESDEDRNQLVRTARLKMSGSEKDLSDKLNYVFLQLPIVKSITDGSSFLEKWAWSVRNMIGMSDKPLELNDSYFRSLFEHSDRRNIREDKLSKYDTMIRDEIQIKAEKEYAVEQARAEALALGQAEGEAKGRAQGRAEGKAEGEKSKQREIAAKLKAAGAELRFISEITGMSLDEVAAL